MRSDISIFAALEWYRRGTTSAYTTGETYDSLDWHESNELKKPSIEDLENAWEGFLQNKKDTEYKELRAAAYPPLQDQFDMIYREGLDTWYEMIQNVKEKYPNPKAPLTPKNGKVMKKSEMQTQLEVLTSKVDALSKHLDSQQLNSNDIQLITKEIQAGMFAIKGFMMEIPNIQKQLKEIQTQLESN